MLRRSCRWPRPAPGGAQEPVILVEHKGKAYPLQILTYHEIANDEIGVSGLLRHSDLVMYDALGS